MKSDYTCSDAMPQLPYHKPYLPPHPHLHLTLSTSSRLWPSLQILVAQSIGLCLEHGKAKPNSIEFKALSRRSTLDHCTRIIVRTPFLLFDLLCISLTLPALTIIFKVRRVVERRGQGCERSIGAFKCMLRVSKGYHKST